MADSTPQPPPSTGDASSASARSRQSAARPARPEVRRFSADELADYDGQEGREAYIAYKGFVFDVTASPLWRKGLHVNEHRAGGDLTAEMAAAPHADDVMARFPIVGVLVADDAPAAGPVIHREPPAFIGFLLRRHMHPVAVHYPMAAGIFAALFTLPALVLLGRPSGSLFEQVAWWLILTGALFTFPAALTGVWSWWYNYGGTMAAVYRAKLVLTVVLALLSAATILLYIATKPAGGQPAGAYWLYTLLVLAHAPTVLALGWYGGKITYPD